MGDFANDTEARAICPGDNRDPNHQYDDLHRAWVRNGRPFSFNREGAWGGAIYYAYPIERGDPDRPQFFIHASAGPTEFDESTYGGPTSLGFEIWMKRRGQLRMRFIGPEFAKRLVIQKVPYPRE